MSWIDWTRSEVRLATTKTATCGLMVNAAWAAASVESWCPFCATEGGNFSGHMRGQAEISIAVGVSRLPQDDFIVVCSS